MQKDYELMADKIDEFVIQRGGVSFVELMRLLGDEAVGKLSYEYPDNCAWWMGMSEKFCDALDECKRRGNIRVDGSSLLVYLIDGRALNLPIAKRPPKNGYKELHWVPVVFNPSQRHSAKKEGRKSQ